MFAMQLSAQQYVHFTINQPDELVITTKDSVYIPANSTAILGPVSVQGGTLHFNYQWTPSTYLLDNTVEMQQQQGCE